LKADQNYLCSELIQADVFHKCPDKSTEIKE